MLYNCLLCGLPAQHKETIGMTFESLSHSRFDCKYHLVFVPKYRKKKLYGEIRRYLGPVFHELAQQKGCKILEGHMVQDHVHMLISIPPKYAVSQIVGYIKGLSNPLILSHLKIQPKMSFHLIDC